jgi:hypothetical protein
MFVKPGMTWHVTGDRSESLLDIVVVILLKEWGQSHVIAAQNGTTVSAPGELVSGVG